MIKVSKARALYIGHMANLEIRAQEFPLPLDDIKLYVEQHNTDVYVAKIQDKHVGHALVTFDELRREVVIDSICTHPDFRRIGVSRQLLKQVDYDAGQMDVFMYVPSYVMEDKADSWCIEQWVWKVGFKAIGERLDTYFRYRRNWDAYVLRLMR